MSTSLITINFQNAVLTSMNAGITISGGAFALDSTSGLTVMGTISFSSLSFTSGTIGFNAQSGMAFNATIVAAVNASGGTPVLEITNVAGTVTVTWPTASGPETQLVTAGDPLPLNGLVG